MNNTIKVDYYDKFNCIADRCSFLCCQGWEILVDLDTQTKWKSNKERSDYFSKKIKIIKSSNGTEGYIKMGRQKCCPFLNDKGLCNIVIKYGDEYLSKTCKQFPRLEADFGNWKEHSLSCACPAVIDMINLIEGKQSLIFVSDNNQMDRSVLAYHIREKIINIMQNSIVSFKDRILLIFHMLLSIKKEPTKTNEIILLYQEDKLLLSITERWSGAIINSMDSFEERNALFLDIVQNYSNEENFRYYLKDIADLANELDIERSLAKWNEFTLAFEQYQLLLENCMISKIFSNCISDDIDEMIMSFQLIITEYMMVKYSTFLRGLGKEKDDKYNQQISSINTKLNEQPPNDYETIDYSDVRDYIVIYSRIIGYNAEGIREFWEDSFDEAVWEFGYLQLLTN